jgi:hypothetical protein
LVLASEQQAMGIKPLLPDIFKRVLAVFYWMRDCKVKKLDDFIKSGWSTWYFAL